MAEHYSLYSIPVLYIISLAPVVYSSVILSNARGSRPNMSNPRGQGFVDVVKKSVPQSVWERHERAKASHANILETLPVFASAVISANLARLDAGLVNNLSAAYLALRVAYIFVYVSAENRPYSLVRSPLWMGGVGISFYLFAKAGAVLQHGIPVA